MTYSRRNIAVSLRLANAAITYLIIGWAILLNQNHTIGMGAIIIVPIVIFTLCITGAIGMYDVFDMRRSGNRHWSMWTSLAAALPIIAFFLFFAAASINRFIFS